MPAFHPGSRHDSTGCCVRAQRRGRQPIGRAGRSDSLPRGETVFRSIPSPSSSSPPLQRNTEVPTLLKQDYGCIFQVLLDLKLSDGAARGPTARLCVTCDAAKICFVFETNRNSVPSYGSLGPTVVFGFETHTRGLVARVVGALPSAHRSRGTKFP